MSVSSTPEICEFTPVRRTSLDPRGEEISNIGDLRATRPMPVPALENLGRFAPKSAVRRGHPFARGGRAQARSDASPRTRDRRSVNLQRGFRGDELGECALSSA